MPKYLLRGDLRVGHRQDLPTDTRGTEGCLSLSLWPGAAGVGDLGPCWAPPPPPCSCLRGWESRMLLRWARLHPKAAREGEAGSRGSGSGWGQALSWVRPPQTMTVAIMDSSASLKLSMRWECWVPWAASSSSSPSPVLVVESPCTLRAGSGARAPDMVGLGRGTGLSLLRGPGRVPRVCQGSSLQDPHPRLAQQ